MITMSSASEKEASLYQIVNTGFPYQRSGCFTVLCGYIIKLTLHQAA